MYPKSRWTSITVVQYHVFFPSFSFLQAEVSGVKFIFAVDFCIFLCDLRFFKEYTNVCIETNENMELGVCIPFMLALY